MLNTRDEQHTLSQPTRRRANTANGKEGLKHASTLRYIQNTGQGQRGEDMLRPRIKAMRADGLKALKVLGARYATLRVVRGLGACITHQGLGTILAVCSQGLSRWACGPFLPHWLSRVFQF